MRPGCGLREPRPEAELLPIVRSHQDDMRRLDEQGPQILATALGYASKDRFATRAELARDEADPGAFLAAELAARDVQLHGVPRRQVDGKPGEGQRAHR